MRFRLIVAHAIFIFLLFPGIAFPEGTSLVLSAGRTVLGLEVEGAQLSSGEMKALIPFSKGSILRPELVREGVVNFYQTGLYEMVEVLLKESPGGVTVKYSLRAKNWLEEIQFQGNFQLDDRELLSKVDLRNSEEITDDKLVKNVERLVQYYKFRGVDGTKITYRVELGKDNRTKVVFQIVEGKRGFISDVRLSGSAGISRTKLLSIISSMPGTGLDGIDLESDIKRVRDHLRKRMYLTPSLTYSVEPAVDFPDGVVIIFNIEKGPEFRLQVLMDDTKEAGKLSKQMRSVFRKSATPEKAKLSMNKIVVDRYLNEGYPFIAADLEDLVEEPGTRSITFRIDRGPKTIIGELRVEGAWFLPMERVNSALGLVPGEPFIKTRMEKGIENLGIEYRREGFLSAAFTREPLNFVDQEGHQEVVIHLTVKEGSRNIIRSLSVAGSPIPEKRTGELLGIKAGDPYVPEFINKGRDALLQELGGMGYLYASVTVAEPEIHPDDTVDLVLTVSEGPLVRLGTVIISGNESVEEKIIRVALDLDRGEILTQDKILKAQERIYGLKVMSSVDVELADPQIPGVNKDLMVRVKERAKYVVGVRAGYGSEDKLRGEVSVTNRNFMGMARSLSLRGKASDIERSTTLLYSHPWFQSLPIDMALSLSDLVEKRESYSRDSLSVGVQFVRALSERTESRVGYVFEGLRLFNVSQNAQLSPDDGGKTDVASVIGEVLHDARDDFLDPWSGVLADITLEYASTILGSKAEYIKTELAVRRYINVKDSIVFAGLLRLGAVTAYGESEEVIISKRFFLGGQNSVRGYLLDSLGPVDANGDPVGGNYLLNANIEMRYPLFRSIRGVIFLDSGSVWLANAVDPENEELKLRSSAGAGIRWTSPIGPLSLDYGYKLNPATDTEDISLIHFSIGHAF
ncbi:MAG: BamA/TamA family outer membrane protein [bacterium]|nr:BamA/TamA family outer membrane protein [bacterium]